MTITFTVGRPSYTWPVNGQLRTICGPAEIEGDDQERTVSLIGDCLKKAREGKSLTVRGTLRVVHHEAYAVDPVHGICQGRDPVRGALTCPCRQKIP
ncbi:hypothetical protein [Gemmata massiliana]|uniref:hypothetical protein n=1 Tax=Gemmata massiliana TaxID=1210884 RepID=UPI0013A6E475|nr:hypothetical protein [Gemmata massiliana]